MDPLPNLIAAIKDAPHDVQSQLVLADHLISLGDERGELIVLHCLDQTGGLTDPEALERLLLLGAEYTFPQARDVPDTMLPFRGEMDPVDLAATHEIVHYRVRYRRRRLSVAVQYGMSRPTVHELPRKVVDRVHSASQWTTEEAGQILRVLTDAIVHRTPIQELQFPVMTDALPVYPAGAVRCYRLPPAFAGPRQINPTRYGLAARDHQRWHELWTRLRALGARSGQAPRAS